MVVPHRDESLTDARTWQERLTQGVEQGKMIRHLGELALNRRLSYEMAQQLGGT